MPSIDALSPAWLRRRTPALMAVLAHAPALAVAVLGLAAGLSLEACVLALGCVAGLTASLWRLPVWWRCINLCFVPVLWLALQAEIGSGWYLAGFALLASTSSGAVRSRVPLYLSSPKAAVALADKLPAHARFMDLGCGLGGPLARLASLRPDLRLLGVEIAPLNWLIARLRLLRRAEVRLGSLWERPLADCDVVYAYLSPEPMSRLWQKVRDEMKPGSLFISNTFAIPGVPPDETLELHDLSHARLLIWRL
jgi:SAM-dependent methyltransferase